MTYLRSPAVHHLDLSPQSLLRFARKPKRRPRGLFSPPYDRPSLTLFNTHCDQVVKRFGLANLHVKDRAMRCTICRDGVGVKLSSGREIATRQLVLSIGSSNQLNWPNWAPPSDARVHHIFDPEFDGWPPSRETVAVIGGGISAGQVALRLLKEGHHVHLVSHHALREHQFDSDPGWLGPKFMRGFRRERDVNRRRSIISEARHTGSVPPDIRRALQRAIRRGEIHWHECEIKRFSTAHGTLFLRLTTLTTLEVDRVLLATGFASNRPGGSLVDELIASAALPRAPCGYPIVDSALRWHPRVHVSGPLAELELGPAARNIVGARHAGDRIVDAAREARPKTCYISQSMTLRSKDSSNYVTV